MAKTNGKERNSTCKMTGSSAIAPGFFIIRTKHCLKKITEIQRFNITASTQSIIYTLQLPSNNIIYLCFMLHLRIDCNLKLNTF